MTVTEARAIIRAEYGTARNIMSPRVLAYGGLPWGAYELSEGEDMGRLPMYGVSVVEDRRAEGGGTRRLLEASRCFLGTEARERAGAYIRALRRTQSAGEAEALAIYLQEALGESARRGGPTPAPAPGGFAEALSWARVRAMATHRP